LVLLACVGCSSPPATATARRAQGLTLEELASVPSVPTPFVDDFTGAIPGLGDATGVSTGFSMFLPRTNGEGHVPGNLAVDAQAGVLTLRATAGAPLSTLDSQDNQLGVGVDLPNGTFRVESTLLGPFDGSGGAEQAGIWFGVSQRDYVRVAIVSSASGRQLQASIEEDNVARSTITRNISRVPERIRFALDVNPTLRSVTASFALDADAEQLLATFSSIRPAWLGQAEEGAEPPARAGFAGIFATQRNRLAELEPLSVRFDEFSVRKRIELPSEPDVTGTAWRTTPALGELTFDNPTGLAEAPGTGHVFVLEREGRVYAADRVSPLEKKLVLDLSSVTQGNQDLGLLGLAFHPEFGQASSPSAGYMYLHYAHTDSPAPSPVPLDHPTQSRLSRFTVDLTTLVADPASEQVLIAQSDEQLWHQGGGMFFHPSDGFLYLSVGDEGDSECRLGNCQRIDRDLFSGVLRIDVDSRGGDVSHPIVRQPESGTTANYFIPNDNPFVGEPGVLEEFYAIGLRQPHRMTFDAVDDITWIGDVGQNLREELDVLAPGANFQWNFLEGSVSHEAMTAMPLGVWTDPVLQLERSESTCVIAGPVYRGAAFPELTGKLIFGDFFFGSVWALDYDYDGSSISVLGRERLLTNMLGRTGTISSFGTDLAGELYILAMGRGARIQQLERGNAADALPARLSGVGAFDDLAALRPIPELEPYSVESPLWSDGTFKERWLRLPSGSQIAFAPDGAWRFPEGTVFVKHFELALDERAPEQRRRLETRFLVAARNERYYGVTYRWNADESDAEPLLEGQEEVLQIIGPDGVAREQTYFYPGPNDCLVCHNADAGYVLGVRTAQLNAPRAGTGNTSSQLVDWAARGLLDTPIDDALATTLPRSRPLGDATHPAEERLRSYWDSNCSMCHGPVTSIRSTWDARATTPLASQGIIGGSLTGEAELPEGSLVVTPGDLERSAMWQRAISTDPALRMPPLGRRAVDTAYVALLEEWIGGL
jgi:glucose/arabinose dehydrogenase